MLTNGTLTMFVAIQKTYLFNPNLNNLVWANTGTTHTRNKGCTSITVAKATLKTLQ